MFYSENFAKNKEKKTPQPFKEVAIEKEKNKNMRHFQNQNIKMISCYIAG